ncbi:hypothetical protein A4G27_23160 [Mycobacterium kansasii]|nr:hypothetical protein A4G27_23160 [Mycobacterium kansasii]
MAHRPEETQDDAQWRTAGDRIQTLLDAASAGGAVARERAEQLVSEVAGFYGAGLGRILDLIDDPAIPDILDRLVADDLVASLLLVHGLHPHDVGRRVADALDSVRPYLGSHGGDVHLLEIVGDTVRLALDGSCKSCPSSAVTLELTVEDAVRSAAPEISSIEVVSEPAAAGTATAGVVIQAESLLAKIHAKNGNPTAWHQLPEIGELAPGQVGGFLVTDTAVLACRVEDQLYVYRDHCPVCEQSLAGAALHRRMGAADVLLRCPRCHSHFDVVHAGAGIDVDQDNHPEHHLDPIPLLVRDGVLSIAVPAEPLSTSA